MINFNTIRFDDLDELREAVETRCRTKKRRKTFTPIEVLEFSLADGTKVKIDISYTESE